MMLKIKWIKEEGSKGVWGFKECKKCSNPVEKHISVTHALSMLAVH